MTLIRAFRHFSVLYFSVLIPLGFAISATAAPNIVLIYADDLGYGDVGAYGCTRIPTPSMDRLAREGLRFTSGYAAATCTPSRYAMLTGQYAWRQKGTGILPGDAALIIQPGRATLASVMHDAGYRTCVVGKWHLGLGDGKLDFNGEIKPGPLEIGFDECLIMAATGDRVPCVYVNTELGNDSQPQLYNLRDDLAEQRNLAQQQPDRVREMQAQLDKIRSAPQ